MNAMNSNEEKESVKQCVVISKTSIPIITPLTPFESWGKCDSKPYQPPVTVYGYTVYGFRILRFTGFRDFSRLPRIS